MINMDTTSLKHNTRFWLFFTIIIGTAILCYRLTASGLWYDECVEFYFSKYATGTTPGFSNFHNMYQRICFTAQPPLYNVLLWLWLRVSDSEIWFRLAGVITALSGGMGIFFYTKKKNQLVATTLTLLYISAFPTRYFALECGEYNLLAANLIWLFVSFCSYIETNKRFYLGLFLFFCTAAVYSQYGAAFVVIGFAMVLVFYLIKYNKKDFQFLFITGMLIVLFAAAPLFYFFLIPQMTAQQGTNTDISHSLSFSVDLAKDFLISIKDTFTYFFLRDQSSIGKVCIILLSVILVILGVIRLLAPDNKQKNHTGEAITLASFISFLLYFFAVKMNYYGMVFVGGTFGNHWGLAIGVMILFVGIFLMSESYASYPKITLFCMAAILFFHGCSLFQSNWQKDNIREVVTNNTALLKEQKTYLTYTEIIPFSYYSNGEFNYSYFDNWTYHCENIGTEKVTEYLQKEFGENPPKEFLLVAGSEDTPSILLEALQSLGYEVEEIPTEIMTDSNLADMPMKSYLYQLRLHEL